jgi:hypothetical protein
MLVKVWHPDRFQTDPKLRAAADEKLKSINAANAVLLSDAAKTRRSARSSQRRAQKQAPAILLRCVILLFGLAIPLLLVFGLDAWLSSDPSTARFYQPYRSRVLFAMQTGIRRVKQDIGQSFHSLSHANATTAAALPASASSPSSGTSQGSVVAAPAIPMPYVTVGLTPKEVASVMGAPVSSTSGALVYKDAVFYLRKGVVAGWKADPSLVPRRIKLWPQPRVDPYLTTYTVGSSRNEVIALQGTPTFLSENKFGYGASEVFFEDDRVIGWNDNHASVRLRVAKPAGASR